jgi:hypothetical protein
MAGDRDPNRDRRDEEVHEPVGDEPDADDDVERGALVDARGPLAGPA